MESKAKLLGHPIHQMLIVFPLGILPIAVISDFVAMYTHNNFWYQMSYYLTGAGIIGGLIAAVFGLVDFLAIPPKTRAGKIGLLHGIGNLIVLALFALSWYLRHSTTNYVPNNLAFVSSISAIALALITAWLGGELVDRLGVGVDDGAHLNAPSSLTNEKIINSVQDASFSQRKMS